MIATLLKADEDIEARDTRQGGTALIWAAYGNQNPAVITALLKAGANINARGRRRQDRTDRGRAHSHDCPMVSGKPRDRLRRILDEEDVPFEDAHCFVSP